MTTIVLRDGVLATDTQMTCGSRLYGQVRKMGRSKDGWWAAGSGDAAVIQAFIRWIETRNLSRLKFPWKGLPEGCWDHSGVLLLAPDGRQFFYEGHAIVPFEAEFAAEGSGAGLAIGAMEMGATAIEAVRVAIKRDLGSGGQIEYVRMGDKEISVAELETMSTGNSTDRRCPAQSIHIVGNHYGDTAMRSTDNV